MQELFKAAVERGASDIHIKAGDFMRARVHGVLQPLVVRRAGKGYEVVAGERRLLAARRAGLKAVPCVVRAVPDELMLPLTLVENIQREDLHAVEEAAAFKALVDDRYGK